MSEGQIIHVWFTQEHSLSSPTHPFLLQVKQAYIVNMPDSASHSSALRSPPLHGPLHWVSPSNNTWRKILNPFRDDELTKWNILAVQRECWIPDCCPHFYWNTELAQLPETKKKHLISYSETAPLWLLWVRLNYQNRQHEWRQFFLLRINIMTIELDHLLFFLLKLLNFSVWQGLCYKITI